MKKSREKIFYCLRIVSIYLLVQCLIFFFAMFCCSELKQVEKEDTQSITFTPDCARRERYNSLSLRSLVFYNGEERYFYPSSYGHRLPNERLEELTQTRITILVEKGSTNIVDFRTEGEIFFTLEEYNAGQKISFVICCILFSLVELVYLFIVGFHLWFGIASELLDKMKLKKRLREKARRAADGEKTIAPVSRKKQKRRKQNEKKGADIPK